MEQLKDKNLGEQAFIPSSMLREGEDIFLDDTTLCEVEEFLKTPIGVMMNDGYEFVEMITGEELEF